ncbi:sugar phosphate isomerase/epimerase family protein [Bryobacter aggregatus]|uniref:sugar phosphate isomerase/epimerase family protein n=1 Tax=Bryobacter aggregatus TaxID=360054 RepID=UPI0004E214AB|nr:sugar phosphate isomerase/epimerase family protein [Bryobacter aggregatus]
MNRREVLWTLGALGSSLELQAKGLDWSRFAVLTDEVAGSEGDAIAFAKQYGLKWVELRDTPRAQDKSRKNETYFRMDSDRLKKVHADLKAADLKVSFLNTGLLKFGLPGTELKLSKPESPEAKTAREARQDAQYAARMKDLELAIRAAHILEVSQLRVFAYLRTAEPAQIWDRLANELGEYARVAEKGGVTLLLENESSCNVATSKELADMTLKVNSKALGMNWDPDNCWAFGEKVWPDGYHLLPLKKLGNVQMKAANVLGPRKIDWTAIIKQLNKDGYKGCIGLETHVFDGTLIEKANLCMKEIKGYFPAAT